MKQNNTTEILGSSLIEIYSKDGPVGPQTPNPDFSVTFQDFLQQFGSLLLPCERRPIMVGKEQLRIWADTGVGQKFNYQAFEKAA